MSVTAIISPRLFEYKVSRFPELRLFMPVSARKNGLPLMPMATVKTFPSESTDIETIE